MTEEQFREAYVHAERTLGKLPIIQAHDTFFSMLTNKLSIEFEYLLSCGWLSVDKVEAERMQRVLLNERKFVKGISGLLPAKKRSLSSCGTLSIPPYFSINAA